MKIGVQNNKKSWNVSNLRQIPSFSETICGSSKENGVIGQEKAEPEIFPGRRPDDDIGSFS